MAITHKELRNLFSEFWKQKEHKEVPPIPLVPQNDPTTLFTGSGMQQLVPYLLGEPHPLGKKLYNIQPAFRAQDIEEVGDNRHTTFFEMMGNWSLGTYFKKEQLLWCWELFIKELHLPKEKVYVSIFEGNKQIPKDEESYQIWKGIGIEEDHIVAYGAEKNWWSRAGTPEKMPAGEPGGPCSEMFYDFGKEHLFHENSKFKDERCHPNCDCGRFVEFGNSVFMEYKKLPDSTFEELPNKNVDFGGGLERILMAVNNEPDVFKTDIFENLYKNIQEKTDKELNSVRIKRIRIFLDHSRAALFLIANNVFPGKNESESVLRRLIRRADDQLNVLFQGNRIFSETVWKNSYEHFKNSYSSIYEFRNNSLDILKAEVKKYENTFKYVQEEKQMYIDLRDNNPISTASGIAGPIAFDYQSSKGVPFETSKTLAEELKFDLKIWEEKYRERMQEHIKISRAGVSQRFKGGLADQSEKTLKYHTATHLLHQALFDILGNEVKQEGSNITGERLRFDFSSSQKPTEEQKNNIQEIVNQKISEALPVNFKIMPKEEAEKVGAKSFFREKYPDQVKVYYISPDETLEHAYSKEFCGGPHVKNTKEIGKVEIYKMEKIGSSLYRIYAR